MVQIYISLKNVQKILRILTYSFGKIKLITSEGGISLLITGKLLVLEDIPSQNLYI
jgi:hypothetical protein